MRTETRQPSLTAAQALSLWGNARWWILGAAWALLLLVCGYSLASSFGVRHFRGIAQLRDARASLRSMDRIQSESASIKSEIRAMDSLLTEYRHMPPFNETRMLGLLYSLADSAGCSATRVTIGQPLSVQGGEEVPVTVEGRGAYAAVGTFVAGIESLPQPTRVRQCTLRAAGDERSFSLDFVVVK